MKKKNTTLIIYTKTITTYDIFNRNHTIIYPVNELARFFAKKDDPKAKILTRGRLRKALDAGFRVVQTTPEGMLNITNVDQLYDD